MRRLRCVSQVVEPGDHQTDDSKQRQRDGVSAVADGKAVRRQEEIHRGQCRKECRRGAGAEAAIPAGEEDGGEEVDVRNFQAEPRRQREPQQHRAGDQRNREGIVAPR